MSSVPSRMVFNESFNGEEVISNLIETAKTLREADALQSEEFFEKAYNLSKNVLFHSGTGECLIELSKINFDRGDVKKSIGQLQEAAGIFERSGDGIRACDCLIRLSEIHYGLGNYEEALEAQLRSLHLCKNQNDNRLIGTIYNKLGEIYKALGDYQKAIENHKHSLVIFETLGDKPMISVTNYYVGNCYNWADDLELSFTYLDKSLELADEINDPTLQVKPTGSLAILFTKLKQYDKALEYFFQAIDYVNITGNLLLKADLMKSLGNLYIETERYEEAIKVLCESLELAGNLNIKYPKNLIHRFLAEAYEKVGDYKLALLHHKSYTALSGEIMNEEVALKTKGIELRYDLEEARKEKELAEKTVYLKDQFIANISHEIRTPLNGVLGMTNLLLDTKPTPEQLEYINTIRLSANNLILIINDILDYSKIHTGEIAFESNEFKVQEVVSGIAQMLKVKSDEKKIRMHFSFDKDIPEVIIGDSIRLNQILLNLVSNAVKFTDKGSVNVEVQMVETKDYAIKILFTVSDTGIGIPEEKLQHIFESFTQANLDNNRVFGGTGLGLAIVRQLVELQGGSITVNSKVGAGSVFKVELPFKLLHKAEKSSGRKGTKSDIPIQDLSQLTILLVEDNKVNQFLAQKLLTKMGFRVEIAGNGHEAVESMKNSRYDVILMDVQMPGMNGYELTQVIRTTLPAPSSQIPIIALTAYASNHEKEKALGLGMSDYITKPYSPHELLSAIMKQVKDKKPVSKNETPVESSGITTAVIRESSEKLIQLFSGSIEDVLSLLHMLVGQIPQLLREASGHIKDQNWPATFQSVHKLKSSVNLLKITSLKNMMDELEEFSRDQIQTERIPPVFEEFSKACDTTVGLLKEEIIRLKKN